jgi:uncharacterized protein (UPF0548 family)
VDGFQFGNRPGYSYQGHERLVVQLDASSFASCFIIIVYLVVVPES